MIALPGQLFYTTQIPVCLWFMTKNKASTSSAEGRQFRDRRGETLFIDAREMGTMIDRVQKELTQKDLKKIAGTYHAWRSTQGRHPEPALPTGRPVEGKAEAYQDIPGYCKSATLKDIAANDYVLTPGRYVGMAEIEDDGIPFEEKMAELSGKLYRQMEESEALDRVIKENLNQIGY